MSNFGEVPPLNGTLQLGDKNKNILEAGKDICQWPIGNLADFRPNTKSKMS